MSKAKNRGTKAKKPPAKKAKRSAFPDQNYGSKKPRAGSAKQPQQSTTKKAGPIQLSQTGLSVPFDPAHKIFLVGEGDFSFATALLQTHLCSNLIATTFESRSQLVDKYPQAAENISALENEGTRVVYNIDATALFHPTKGGGSNLRKLAPFDRIVFNFPHTGGLTKDVNRQVRANQELCVRFLEAACKDDVLSKGGRIVITLFEGEPYELWGIRNLARHAGLAVIRSTRFEWERYPGYAHARTLGNLRGTGWKGEERKARMYIFGRPGEEEQVIAEKSRKRKRGGHDDGDTEDGDEHHEDEDEDVDHDEKWGHEKAEELDIKVVIDNKAEEGSEGEGAGDESSGEFDGFVD